MDIKNEIKNEVNGLQIKTTSQDILSRYENETQKKRFPFWIPISASLSLATMAAAVSLIVVNLPKKEDVKPPVSIDPIVEEVVSLNDDSPLSQTGLQLFYSSQIEKGTKSDRKQAIRFSNDFQVNITDREERIKANYFPLFKMANNFFSTRDQLSFVYGKTSFSYHGEKYSYVLSLGKDKVFTQNDISGEISMTQAVFSFSDELYEGFIYMEQNGEGNKIRSCFNNGNKAITILKDEDEEGSGLFYQISDVDEDENAVSEFYKISTEFSKDGSSIDDCRIIHSSTKGIIKATTDYEKASDKYFVDYSDVFYSPFSLLKTQFSFTLDENDNIVFA